MGLTLGARGPIWEGLGASERPAEAIFSGESCGSKILSNFFHRVHDGGRFWDLILEPKTTLGAQDPTNVCGFKIGLHFCININTFGDDFQSKMTPKKEWD